MKFTLPLIAVALLAAGCTTPKTMLKHPKTGQIITCGDSATGSLMFGAVGYNWQKEKDADCVSYYTKEGFKVISEEPTK